MYLYIDNILPGIESGPDSRSRIDRFVREQLPQPIEYLFIIYRTILIVFNA